jgi:hypothetical protein
MQGDTRTKVLMQCLADAYESEGVRLQPDRRVALAVACKLEGKCPRSMKAY